MFPIIAQLMGFEFSSTNAQIMRACEFLVAPVVSNYKPCKESRKKRLRVSADPYMF